MQNMSHVEFNTIFEPCPPIVSYGFVWFYDKSTILGHLIPNPFIHILKYMISNHILKITFLKA